MNEMEMLICVCDVLIFHTNVLVENKKAWHNEIIARKILFFEMEKSTEPV